MATRSVLIIGGGIIGCALAESLARAGCRVTVLEAATVGAEASSAAAGLLAPQIEAHGPGPFLDVCLVSRALYPEVVARLERETGLTVDFQPTGLLFAVVTAADAEEAEQRLAWQVQRGLSIQRLTREELLRREPSLTPAVRWGLWFPEDHQVDSAQLTRAYAEAARRQGATFVEGVRVSHVRRTGGRVEGVSAADSRTWDADTVVDCAGSWARLDYAMPFDIPVEPAKGQILCYDTTGRMLLKRTVKSSQVYCVPRSDGRLLVGTTMEFVGFDREIAEATTQDIQARALALCPMIAEYTMTSTWANFRPATPDRLPLLGATPMEGFFVATGHFRNGVLLAPITAQLMTELILTGTTAIPLTPFALQRFLTA